MASFAPSRSLSAVNCSLDDTKKEEEAEEEDEKEKMVGAVASKFSGIVVRLMQGDTGAPVTLPVVTLFPSISTSKKLPQRPSQPPPPPPCPSGDTVEEDIAAGEPGQFTLPSAAQMTELHLQLQQQQLLQQPRYKYRPGQRSPIRQMVKLQTPQSKVNRDKKYDDEKATGDAAAASAAAAGKTVISSSEILTGNVLQDTTTVDGLDQTSDVIIPQKPRDNKEDAARTAETADDVATTAVLYCIDVSAADGSSKPADDDDSQTEVVLSTTTTNEVDRCSPSSTGNKWMKRPCGVIAEEASLDEVLEKTEKLERELRKQLDLKKQKMLDNARQKERIEALENMNSELQTKIAETEIELTRKDIKLAVVEEKNDNLAKRLKSTQDVLGKLESDYERVVEEKLEFKSLYLDSRLKTSETIGEMTEEINRQIEAKRAFIRIIQQTVPASSGNSLKRALATTNDYLHLKCERNQLMDKVQYLKTRVEAQDLYIDDLSSAVKELSRIIQHYKVSLPSMEENNEAEQEEHGNQAEVEEDDHSSTGGRCAALTDESSGEVSPTSHLSAEEEENSADEEEEAEVEDQPNPEDDLEQELEDICDEISDCDSITETTTTTEDSVVLEFRTPMSSPTSSVKSQASRHTPADDEDDDAEEEEEDQKAPLSPRGPISSRPCRNSHCNRLLDI